ncbi:hypothetical protein IMZ48_43725 [Candidatus Bathyarchaeota archaeon]|nr:hypothetical protein [Candidatus Bathyarchaeota archaeon]
MNTNHRSIMNLAMAPSDLIYRGSMQVPAGKAMFPESAKLINRILRGIHPGLGLAPSTTPRTARRLRSTKRFFQGYHAPPAEWRKG